MNMIRQPVWFCLKRCSLSLQPIQDEGSSHRGKGGHQKNMHTHTRVAFLGTAHLVMGAGRRSSGSLGFFSGVVLLPHKTNTLAF